MDFLPDSSKVKIYLLEKCSHLLEPLKGNTGIYIKLDMPTIESKVDLGVLEGMKQVSKYSGIGGVYLFSHKESNDFYIGSTIDFYTRFKTHQTNSIKPNRGGNSKFYKYFRENGSWSSFNWFIIKSTPNHIFNFVQINPSVTLDHNEFRILLYFTQFEARIYEQALLSYYSPSLNSSTSVTFGFVNWQPELNINNKYKVTIEVYDKFNHLINSFPSKRLATKELGLGLTTINQYLNKKFLIESPKLEMDIYIVDPSKPLSNKPLEYFDYTELPTITDVDLFNLPQNRLVALLSDKITVFGTYHNAPEAALLLDNKKESKYIGRYINKERLVKAGDKLLYFVMHPDYKDNLSLRRKPLSARNTNSIVLVDMIENTALKFPTIKNLLLYLGHKSSKATAFVKRYMDPPKLYKNRYLFVYEKDYKGIITGEGPDSKNEK
jgi:hypothetical protein